jgi:vitamin B12 transporter
MHKLTPALAALAGTSAFLNPNAVHAQTEPTIDEVVVTATRSEQPLSDTLAPTTLIDRKDIDNSNAESVQELLEQRVPGLQMSNSGGPGKDTSVYMRGTNSDHVLVLVNGIKQSSATLGTTAFQHLPLEQIERIEVVRGPRSSLYGAEAIGGVIQIFTRDGGQGFQPHAEAGYGSHERKKASAGVRGGTDGTRYSLNLGYVATEGINALEDNNPDEDGYERASASASLRQQVWSGGEAELKFMRAQGTTEYDNSFDPNGDYEDEFVQQSVAGTLSQTVSDAWRSRIRVGESRDESEINVDGSRTDFYDTRRLEASWRNNLYLTGTQEAVLGLDYRDDRVDSNRDYAEDSRSNKAVYGQWQGSWDPLAAGLSLRFDDNEAYGEHTTGNADLGYRLSDGLKLVASYGTAFKAPTFNELFYPGFSNPDLEAEESRSGEVGLEGRFALGSWELRAFETRIEQLIVNADTDGDGFVDTPVNLGEARIRGMELGADLGMAGWRVRPSASYLDPEDTDSGNQLPRRAKFSGNLDIQKRLGERLSLGATVVAKGKRYDGVENTEAQEMPAYGLLHLRASYAFADSWQVRFKANNVLEEDYESAKGYNTLGRTFFASLSYGG